MTVIRPETPGDPNGPRLKPLLTDFLLARIAEDEDAARAATQGRWEYRNPYSAAGLGGRYNDPGECAMCHSGPPIWSGRRDINGEVIDAHVHVFPPYDHSIVVLDGGMIETVVPDGDEYGHVNEADGEHIVRHNPARVLARCAADRRIVEFHRPMYPRDSRYLPNCEGCWEEGGEDGAPTYPCHTVRWLAAVYADHPDYDEEWRP